MQPGEMKAKSIRCDNVLVAVGTSAAGSRSVLLMPQLQGKSLLEGEGTIALMPEQARRLAAELLKRADDADAKAN